MKKWGPIVAAAAVIAAAAWWLLREEPAAGRLMRSLPAGQAAYLYVDMERLRDSELLGADAAAAFSQNPAHGLLANRVEAGAAAIGEDAVFVVLAARVPETLLRRALEDAGADCARPLDEAACEVEPLGVTGSLSLRLLGDGVVAAASGPRPGAADALAAVSGPGAAALAEPAAAAVRTGALAWMEIDPPRLAAVMRNPPEGWINLSLIARALMNAEQARLTLQEGDGGELLLRMRAVTPDAAELAKVLEGLNRFGAAAMRKSASPEAGRWADAFESFEARPGEGTVEAVWRLAPELLGAPL